MLYAMFTLVLLTIVIGITVIKARMMSVRKGQLSVGYFKLMQANDVPELVTKTTRCFNNLFEVPVLFYTVCTLYIALGLESSMTTVSAWLFVAFRVIQALIHIGNNNVLHRMYAFVASVLCVLFLWGDLVVVMS